MVDAPQKPCLLCKFSMQTHNCVHAQKLATGRSFSVLCNSSAIRSVLSVCVDNLISD